MPIIVDKRNLPDGGDFEGYRFGEVGTSFIWVEANPGEGPKLHRHPYAEVFVVLEGRARYTVGDETVEAGAGQVLIAPAGTPHRFVNAGPGPLKQIDIHASDRFDTEWLEA